MTGVYKITNMVNGKVYIGQAKDIEKRWKAHENTHTNKNSDEYEQVLYRAMRKYGFKNFSFEILMLCEEDLLNLMEIYYIQQYNSYIHFENSNGYNMTLGGDGVKGYVYSKKEKESRSKRMKRGNNNKARKVECGEKIFDCAKDCAEYYNETYGTMLGWLTGTSRTPQKYIDLGLKYITEAKCKKVKSKNRVICDGKVFENVRAFCLEYDLVCGTVRDWLNGRKKMPKEWYDRGLRYENKQMSDYKVQDGKHSKKIVWCENIKFNSIKECEIYYGEKARTLAPFVNGKRPMPKIWYDRGLHLDGKEMKDYEVQKGQKRGTHPHAKKVYCDGIVFDCLRDCSDYYNINYDRMRAWLSGRNPMPQHFIDLGLKYL